MHKMLTIGVEFGIEREKFPDRLKLGRASVMALAVEDLKRADLYSLQTGLFEYVTGT